jgi:hypothetical protein
VRLREGRMVERRWLVRELMRCKGLRVLRLKTKRVGILEVVMSAQGVGIEALKVRIGRSLASVDSALRGGEGERCA